MKDKEPLFSIDYLMAFTGSIILRTVIQYKITLIPIYMLSLGFPKVQAGLAMTVFTISALVLRPVCGNLIDRYGRKSMLLLGILVFSISTAPVGLSQNLYFIYILQVFSGLSFSIQTVALTTIVTDLVPESRLTEGLGYFGLTASITQAIGPSLAAWSEGLAGYNLLFLSGSIAAGVSLISLIFIKYESQPSFRTNQIAAEEPEAPANQNFIDRIAERRALRPSLYMGSIALIGSATVTFLVPYSEEVGMSSIGLFFAARAAGIAASRILAGKLTEKINSKILICIGITGVITGTAGLSIFRSTIPLILIAFAYGFGYGMIHVLFNVAAVINTPKNRRAHANATYYLAMDAGVGAGSFLWGGIGDLLGLESIFPAASLLAIVVLIWFVFSRQK